MTNKTGPKWWTFGPSAVKKIWSYIDKVIWRKKKTIEMSAISVTLKAYVTDSAFITSIFKDK